MFPRSLLTAALLLSFTCAAQDLGSLAGIWNASFSTVTGIPRTAKIVIAGDSGTWQTAALNRDNPCIGREVPIAISNVTREGFGLAVIGSKALQGCPDSAWELKRMDDDNYEGQFGDGRKFVLSRKGR